MHNVSNWFIDNPIAAKILMVLILVGGVFTFPLISKQFFPVGQFDIIQISMTYPGAGPEEVESQLIKRIEEAVEPLSGIEEIRAVAKEGFAQIFIDVEKGESTPRLMNDVKANVESIATFPVGAEPPQIVELRYKLTIMRLLLLGELAEHELKELGESIREELADIPSVMMTELSGVRDYEVSIEISESALSQYGLSFTDVSNAIKGYSFTLPAGKINDAGGDIQLQARLQAEDAQDFYQIPIVRTPQGSIVRVSDVATINDGFIDIGLEGRFNGTTAIQLEIINRERPQILRTAKDVRAYVERKQQELPNNVSLQVWTDSSVPYQGRLDTLLNNGLGGLILVYIILVLFLRPMLALWVCTGIVVAFSGALWALSFTPVTLNVMSLFSFIMILGIIVDDAIIVGEAVYSQQSKLGDRRLGAIAGVKSVMAPVWFAVVSTIVFFIPFYYLSDIPDTSHIATPVILALVFSLIESLFLLPSHLAHGGLLQLLVDYFQRLLSPFKSMFMRLEFYRQRISASLPYFASTYYRRALLKASLAPSFVLMLFMLLFSITITLVASGWIKTAFAPRVSSDYVIATADLPESSSFEQAYQLMQRIEKNAFSVRDDVNKEYNREIIQGVHATAVDAKAIVTIRLDSSSDRPVSAGEVSNRLRRQIGQVSGIKDLSVRFTTNEIPKPIEFNILSSESEKMKFYADDIVRYLAGVQGVYDVRTSLEHPAQEINFSLNKNAESLSVSTLDIATQIRQAFYGDEVQRIPREREDVKVFLRYPNSERGYEEELNDMLIKVPNGASVPLNALVDFDYRDSLKTIDRIDGKRVAVVGAELSAGFNASEIVDRVMVYAQTELSQRYPSVQIQLKGEEEEQREFREKIRLYFVLSMLVIFGLMAVMFRSYAQPILVISAVPFGYMGGVLGHYALDVTFSMMSMLGGLACAGVVVNDNVVLIDRINQLRKLGYSVRNAVINGAIDRFRPIVLTSVTTFLGLTPVLLENSVQARFLTPMVTSLSFGVLFATFVTLLFVPSLYLFGYNVGRYLGIGSGSHPSVKVDAIEN